MICWIDYDIWQMSATIIFLRNYDFLKTKYAESRESSHESSHHFHPRIIWSTKIYILQTVFLIFLANVFRYVWVTSWETVLALCIDCMLSGEKLRPLIIGKSAKPRCFAGLSCYKLPLDYCNDNKAWMTSRMFEERLGKCRTRTGKCCFL